MTEPTDPLADQSGPQGHDTQLVAVFETSRLAADARHALLGAGIPPGAIEIAEKEGAYRTAGADAVEAPREAESEGFWAAVGRLFAPHDDAEDLGHALGRGHVLLMVHPESAAERETAIEVLEGCGPLDIEDHREAWRSAAGEPIAAVASEAAPARSNLVRIVEERLRVGWRERPDSGDRPGSAPTKVRSYVAPRPASSNRVELLEEEIGGKDHSS